MALPVGDRRGPVLRPPPVRVGSFAPVPPARSAGSDAAAGVEVVPEVRSGASARPEAGGVTKADPAAFATREALARMECRLLPAALAVAGLPFAALRFFG